MDKLTNNSFIFHKGECFEIDNPLKNHSSSKLQLNYLLSISKSSPNIDQY